MGQSVFILGARGHGKVVLATLEAVGIVPLAIYDDDASKWGSHLFNIPITGGLDGFAELGAVSAFIAIGKCDPKKDFCAFYKYRLDCYYSSLCIHSCIYLDWFRKYYSRSLYLRT
jgi:PglD N-terminal domain